MGLSKPDPPALSEEGLDQSIPGEYKADWLPPGGGLSLTAIAWPTWGTLCFWAVRIPETAQEGTFKASMNPQEEPPQQSSGEGPVHEEAYGNKTYSSGTRIGDAVGNVATSFLGAGATNEQAFDGIDPNLLTLLRETPSIPPVVGCAPGETVIGRVIGNLRTGHIGANAISKQSFGSVKTTSGNTLGSMSTNFRDEEASRQGYSAIGQHAQSSSYVFATPSRGQTLGQAPEDRHATTSAIRCR